MAQSKKASDIHISVGAPILFRCGKDLIPSTGGNVTLELCERLITDLLNEDQLKAFHNDGDFDLLLIDNNEARYRVNVSMCNQSPGLVIRVLAASVPSVDALQLPPVVHKLANMTKGLVLVTGSTSQGKTTTMSAIINEINEKQRRHIVTIEDPIEILHRNKKSLIRQREVGRDTDSFYRGLRSALRQDPDIIAIGEMRDYETIRIALIAAETGVLVLSTLHIISIDKLVERMLSYAPMDDQSHFRYLLADALQGVIHQELVPTVDGGKRVATEVMVVTDAIRNIIRSRDSFHLRNALHTGSKHGMVTMRQSVDNLLETGVITPEAAQNILANYV